jgi:hypothetical protein
VTALDLITPQYAYVLGLSFGVPLLETQNREYVIVHFQKWLNSPEGDKEWKILLRWAEPVRIVRLIRDGTSQKDCSSYFIIVSKVGQTVGKFKASMKPAELDSPPPRGMTAEEVVQQQFAAAQM